ncbi:MAG TPA: DEAD/DEAH box helicase family protein [Polyangia bacterium]|jgi:superfamily II DNA or RNA helicase
MRLLFDRGTILLDAPPAELDPTALPGVAWDDRVAAHRAPGCRYAEIRAALVRRGVRFTDAVRPAGQGAFRFAALGLREYQQAALAAWQLAGRRGVVALPTGSGKTRVALGALAASGLSALCLVPTRVLLEQWRGELARVHPGAVGCYGDGARELAPVTVATFESAWRYMPVIGHRFDLLVVDEAHHFGAGVRDETLEMCAAAARLGLTATPPRPGPQAARLAALLGPTVYELAIADLAGTFLASFDVVTWHVDLEPDERRAYNLDRLRFQDALEAFWRDAPGAPWREFVRCAERTPTGRLALAAWRRSRRLVALCRGKRRAVGELLGRHRDGRVLLFTADNESAYSIARAHLVMPLTCDIRRAERADALERFRRGELRALVSSRVLNEGLDVPDADVAVILGGTLGEREHVQRIGRVLRPGPGKRALVYELVTRDTFEVRQAARRRLGLAPRIAAQL